MKHSDPDATLYYLARMIEAGEDPKYIARRIIVCTSEDIGLADSQALDVAVNAFLGMVTSRKSRHILKRLTIKNISQVLSRKCEEKYATRNGELPQIII